MGCCWTSVLLDFCIQIIPPRMVHQLGHKLELHTKKDHLILYIYFKKMHDLNVLEMHSRLT